MQHGHDSMEAMKRLLSLVLCAIQVIAFVLGGALLARAPPSRGMARLWQCNRDGWRCPGGPLGVLRLSHGARGARAASSQ